MLHHRLYCRRFLFPVMTSDFVVGWKARNEFLFHYCKFSRAEGASLARESICPSFLLPIVESRWLH